MGCTAFSHSALRTPHSPLARVCRIRRTRARRSTYQPTPLLSLSFACCSLGLSLLTAASQPRAAATAAAGIMLSVRLLRVRGVLIPDSTSSTASPSEQVPSWTVELRHGPEKHRTSFLALAPSNPAAPLLQHEPRRTDLRTASGSPWRDIEFEDMGGEEKVDVTLLFDPSPKYPSGVRKRQLFRHSMASIDVQAFRSQPEKRMEVWLPLQPANPRQDSRDYGAMQVAVMYTDDYVAQGYMFGLFCGLSPLWKLKHHF